MQGQLWDPAVLEQWASAIATPSMHMAHLGLAGPHEFGTEFIRQVVTESHKVWLSHAKAREGLIKAQAGPGGTMAWVLQELQLHQQVERQGPQDGLEVGPSDAGAHLAAAQVRNNVRTHTHTPMPVLLCP